METAIYCLGLRVYGSGILTINLNPSTRGVCVFLGVDFLTARRELGPKKLRPYADDQED